VPGPHDFIVRSLHRTSDDTIRVHRIPPHVRDDAYVPLAEAGRRQWITIFRKTEVQYFSRQDWTADSPLNWLANFDSSRMVLQAFARSRVEQNRELICPTNEAPPNQSLTFYLYFNIR
jgi:hypothetical protein